MPSELQPLFYGPLANIPLIFIYIVFIWSIFWKGLTLWKTARYNQRYWFIALLIVNTIGILEIIYLLLFQKDKNKKDVK
jgi:hypothetical protein